MIRYPLLAFLTGLHLALMQFGYFFVLLINVTSTYVTYAVITISWMLGAIIGLKWRRIPATALFLLGTLAYYAVYLYIWSAPFSPFSWPIASLGVAITGLWAGRFFVVALPRFDHAGQLFFHENNGFLLGVAAVFVGFTLLGQGFLLWAPALSCLGLLIIMAWRGVGQSQPSLGLADISEPVVAEQRQPQS